MNNYQVVYWDRGIQPSALDMPHCPHCGCRMQILRRLALGAPVFYCKNCLISYGVGYTTRPMNRACKRWVLLP